MLDDIFKCQIPYIDKYVKNVNDDNKKYTINWKLKHTTCRDIGVCQMNSQMCQGQLCPNASYDQNKSLPPQCKQQCTPPEKYSQKQKDYLVEKCKQSEASVIKVIRISELADVMPFYEDSEYDLRVILSEYVNGI